MVKQSDIEFLAAICGEGETCQQLSLMGVMRKGRLLLALPRNRDAALKTLSLYQPQTAVGKIYIIFVKCCLFLRCHLLLEKLELEIKESSPLRPFIREGEVGFLLGNPESAARRAIIYHTAGDQQKVTKLGVGEPARQTIIEEYEAMQATAAKAIGAPVVLECFEDSSAAYYTVEWIKGRSPSAGDSVVIIEHLGLWHHSGEPKPLADLAVWKPLLDACAAREWREYLESIQCVEVVDSIVHGDFAPWNIKIDADRNVHVLDWELCRENGAAGWDWAHYLIQTKLLVEKLSAQEVIEETLKWAETADGMKFLEASGWGRRVNEWLGSYLLYTHYLLKLERKELIECWQKNAQISC